jgi:hypothetical protein
MIIFFILFIYPEIGLKIGTIQAWIYD